MVGMPKAIEWLEKGMLYCESYSAYELALIYLYNDEYKNVERGLMCLNRCVEDNYIQGIEGLANILVSTVIGGRGHESCERIVGEGY